MDPDLLPLREFTLALLIGALIGVEREKRLEIGRTGPGGLRTFILLSEAGAVAAWLSVHATVPGVSWIFIAGLIGLTLLLTAGHALNLHSVDSQTGMTTETAAVITYLLGGAAVTGHSELAVALAIATSALLALKNPLHDVVARLHRKDILAGLKLLFATFIVLPLLPDEPIDPWGALPPSRLWLVVVIVSALSLGGYVAVRWLGPTRGTAVTGLAGGIVASTPLTVAFARRSRDDEQGLPVLRAALLLAWSVMFVRSIVEVGIVNLPLVPRVAPPLLLMGLVLGVPAALGLWRSRHHGHHHGSQASERLDEEEFEARRKDQEAAGESQKWLRNPFSLTAAIHFAAVFAVVLVAVEIAQLHLPPEGMYLVTFLSSLTNTDAIILALAGQARDQLDPQVAVNAIILATLTNTLAKLAIVAVIGRKSLARRLLVPAIAVTVVGGGIILAGVLST